MFKNLISNILYKRLNLIPSLLYLLNSNIINQLLLYLQKKKKKL